MTRFHLRGLLIVICSLLLIASSGAGAATADGESAINAPILQTDSADNSTQTYHEHPDVADQDGDTSQLEARIVAELADRLTESTLRMDEGEYQTAQRLIGEQYETQVELYAEIYERPMDGELQESDEEVAEIDDELQQMDPPELFMETAERQSEYAETAETYQDVQTEYETAQQTGDQDRTLQLAQQLDSLSGELQELNEELTELYQLLDLLTDEDFETAESTLNSTTLTATQQTEGVLQESYSPTSMSADASDSGSFADPVQITGEITAEGDSPPSGNASFLVNGQPHDGTIESDGSFTVAYRPTTEALGQTSIDIIYVPGDGEPYLSSSTTVPTTITQESSTVSITTASETTQATSSVTAAGQLTVDGVAVPSSSVSLSVGDREIAETQTDENGEYEFDDELPSNLSTGPQTLAIQGGQEGTALAPVAEETTLTVEETETFLSMQGVWDNGSITVSGQLLDEEEQGLGEQDIAVSLYGDSQQQTVQTDSDGNYEVTMEPPEEAENSSAVPIQVEFDGTDTSFAPSTASAALEYPTQGRLAGVSSELLLSVGVGLLLITIGGYGLYWYRRTAGTDVDIDETVQDDTIGSPGAETIGSPPPSTVEAETADSFVTSELEEATQTDLLSLIDDWIENGDLRGAVVGLYGTVRHELGREANASETHWEFFNTTADRLSDEQRSVLRELTETFETVQFADRTPSSDTVTALRTDIERVLAAQKTNSNTTNVSSEEGQS